MRKKQHKHYLDQERQPDSGSQQAGTNPKAERKLWGWGNNNVLIFCQNYPKYKILWAD